jgi:hypothetical protein
MVPNVSLDASSLINLFLLTRAVNVAAVSAGGTHIVGAPLDAIGAAIVINDDCKTGNAPIFLDGRILEGKLSRANRHTGILSRTEVLVRGIVAAAMNPIETRETFVGGAVVLAATQTVKRFESGAHGFGSGKIRGSVQEAVDGSRLVILFQAAGSSASGDGQDGTEKESKGHGKELHG